MSKRSSRWGQNGEGYGRVNSTHHSHFVKAIQKYGWENFEHEVLFNDLTKADADFIEDSLIIIFDTMNPDHGYNKRGGGSQGTLSDETRQRISENVKIAMNKPEVRDHLIEVRKQCFKGEKNPNFGKKLSSERKAKISSSVTNYQLGLVWMYKDNTEIQVKPADIEIYSQKGFVKGRFFDKVWIHKNSKTKMVSIQKIESYLTDGWIRGRK